MIGGASASRILIIRILFVSNIIKQLGACPMFFGALPKNEYTYGHTIA